MPDAFGYNAHVGVAEEVTWGTPVAAALYNEFDSEDIGYYIRKMPKSPRSIGALEQAASPWAKTLRVSTGSIMP